MRLDDLKYEKIADGYRIFGFAKSTNSLDIPEGVVEIGERAFADSDIISLTLPKSLKRICRRAFAGCIKLREINFAEDGELELIGSQAFLECDGLTEIKLPRGITAIEFDAFAACYSLTEAYIPADVRMIGEHIFAWCDMLNKVTVGGSSIPRGWSKKWLGCDAGIIFDTSASDKKKSAPAPKKSAPLTVSVKPLKKAAAATARSENKISAATAKATDFPEKTEQKRGTPPPPVYKASPEIEKISPRNEAYTPMAILRTEPCDGGLRLLKCLNSKLEELILPPDIVEIGPEAFKYNANLRVFKAGSRLKCIRAQAFMHCTSLHTAEFPNNTSVCEYAFDGTGLTHANISFITFECAYAESAVKDFSFVSIDGYEISSIPDYLFMKTKIESISIPESVSSIGKGAFEYCLNLKSVKIPNSVSRIYQSAFEGCSALTELEFPEKQYGVSAKTCYFCKNLKRVKIADNPGAIGEHAFYGCHSLEEIVIPSGIYRIDSCAIASNSLKKVTFEGKTYNEVLRLFDRGWLVKMSPSVKIVCTDKTVVW